MTSLRDEIAADQGVPTQCTVCRWLTTLDDASRAEWTEVIGDRAFTHASIHRAIIRRNDAIGRSAVENHRQAGHK